MSFCLRLLFGSFALSVSMMANEKPDFTTTNPDDSRRAHLDFLLDNLIPSTPPSTGRVSAIENTWEDWVKRTGELPPDFDSMPSNPFLPDPLTLWAGPEPAPIESMKQWQQQRSWIRSQIEHWVFGTMPPAPDNLRVASTSERREGNVTVRDVLLEFGPGHRATLNLQLLIPDGDGPFPVFLTNHSPHRSFWPHVAAGRGYIACYYRATDPFYGHPDDSDTYIDIYPNYDFSCLGRWAWAGSRAVDYLLTLPEVNAKQIGLTGHSRNGKQALLAAAFDERIGAVVASSGLTGEALPWRYTADPFVVESIQLLTGARPHWFHPRLRFFTGREDRLPVDQNLLMALVAPRGLMIYSAFSEGSANAFALEQIYRSASRAYRFLDAGEKIQLYLRDGEHSTEVADVENFMDFFDSVFGRADHPKFETWIFGYDFEEWKRKTGEAVDPLTFPVREPGEFLRTDSGDPISDPAQWEKRRAEIRARIEQTLGEAPPASSLPLNGAFAENSPPRRNPLELVFRRPERTTEWRTRLARDGMGISSLPFGPGHAADLFYPVDNDGSPRDGRWPVVIWLHPYAHAHGWSAKSPWNPRVRDFVADQRPDFASLAQRGYAVVAFDQIGFGSRAHEARTFYDRYPDWSLLGKMIADTRAVIDAISVHERLDASNIHLLGYSLGAKVGLLTTALDERVSSVTAICGFSPFRLHQQDDGTEGLQHYSHLHGLIPRLGFFIGHETRVPFDYDEVLALAAPRTARIVAPEMDRFAPVEAVRGTVETARKTYSLYDRPDALRIETPRDFNRFPKTLQDDLFSRLDEIR